MKILATNHDMGSAQAMVPALQELKRSGIDVATCAVPEAPALGIFHDAGLDPKTLDFYGGARRIFDTEKPKLVFVGVSATDAGSEKMALVAARECGIKTACIVESWPHLWLQVFGGRDIPLYREVDLMLMWDQVSCEHAVSLGFDPTKLVATGNPSQDAFAAFKIDRAKHRAEMRARFDIADDAVVIQWSMSADLDDPQEDRPGHPSWLGFSEAESVREFLEALRDSAEDAPHKVRGIIRQKPTHGSTRVRGMIRDICPSVVFDNARYQMGVPVILASDIVVGSATMMVQNAAMLGVPGLFYFPDLNKPDPMIANSLGFTIPMYVRGDLSRLIRNAAHMPDPVGGLKSRIKPIDLQIDATGNVVKAIKSLLGT